MSSERVAPTGPGVLSEHDQAILRLERSWWETGRPKDDLIAALGCTAHEYAERLAALVDSQEALALEPLLVRRLRRERDRRVRARAEAGRVAR